MIIQILDEAQQDLIDGFQFYEQRVIGLGSHFLDCLFTDIDSLISHAGIHQVVFGYHRCLSKRFPFAVYYALKQFSPAPRDVCRIQEGSTNQYLSDSRAVEDFLNHVEPKYNLALDALESSDIDDSTVMTVAGFIAYVYSRGCDSIRDHFAPLSRLRLSCSTEKDQERFQEPFLPFLDINGIVIDTNSPRLHKTTMGSPRAG